MMQISAKDLSYLSDEMSWELIAMKKYHHFASEVQDPALKATIEKLGTMHQNHYQALLGQLQSASEQTNSYMQ